MKLISIIVPIYNAKVHLNECLQSILTQSTNNWEVLLINDYSTDESHSICEKFVNMDDRFRYFENVNNKGIIGALKTGHSKSKGALITRMDADDIMAENKLKSLSDILSEKGRGTVAVGLVKYFSETTLGNGYLKYEQWLNSITSENSNFRAIYKECVIPSPAWMCFREDFEACGAFDSDIYPEDYDLTFRFYKHKLKCFGTKDIVHFWRDHQNRTSRNDENYADNRFLSIKVKYFLELDYKKHKQLMLWGAGKKGKLIAQLLIKKDIPFKWICNNDKKIGKSIYGVLLEDSNKTTHSDCQYIIAIAGDKQQKEIKEQLETITEVYFFC